MRAYFLLLLSIALLPSPSFADNLADTPTAIPQSNQVTADVESHQALADFKNPPLAPIPTIPPTAPIAPVPPVVNPIMNPLDIPKLEVTDDWEAVPPFDPESEFGKIYKFFNYLQSLVDDPKYICYETYFHDDDGNLISTEVVIYETLANGAEGELVGGFQVAANGELMRLWNKDGPMLIGPNDVSTADLL